MKKRSRPGKYLTKKELRDRSYSGFDNAAASAFISRPAIISKPATMAEISKKHCKSRAKTTVVHLEERNDYAPPHSQLTHYFGENAYIYLE